MGGVPRTEVGEQIYFSDTDPYRLIMSVEGLFSIYPVTSPC
jgi:hypothetical protein